MIPLRHVLSQGAVLRAMGAAALRRPATAIPATPGPWFEERVQPRPAALIRDYLRAIGADPSWYRGRLPAHLFPQWGFPLAARAMAGLPYPITRVLNAGCRLEIKGPLADDKPFDVRARLESIDADDRRALITTRIETADALVAELHAFVPLAKKSARGNTGARVSERLTPQNAQELTFLELPPHAGLDFAKLTGDFNPIHWIPAAARAAGFKGCILHGFGTMSRAIAALDRGVFAGDPTRLTTFDARFTRPLTLPARVGVYVRGDQLWVSDAPGGGTYLEATYGARS